MSLDLSFDDAQQAIADAVGQFCRDRCDEAAVKTSAGKFPAGLWKELAELGVLAIGTPEGEGGALELVAALESLGRSVFPGPLVETVFAGQLLPEAERVAVTHGAAVVSVGTPPLMPWAPVAQVFVALDGDRAWRAAPSGPIEPVEMLGGEPWGRVELERGECLGPVARARTLADVALSAYLAAAGEGLVAVTAEHARTRKQFGRAIGEFQAVAHSLADCAIRLGAARTLARAAAFHLDRGSRGDDASASASAARLSAAASALEAAHTCHQLFGALGITLEGPVFHVSRRILQLAASPPGDRARDDVLAPFGL